MWLATLVVVAITLSACGARGILTAALDPTPDALVRPAGSCEAPTCQVVNVTLGDFTIVPATIQITAPSARFVLTNTGTFTHGFKVEANGAEYRSPNIGPGQTGYLEVELAAGDYSAICPIQGHAVRGQRAAIEVSVPG